MRISGFFIQIAGVDAAFRQVDRREESDATLTGLPGGATVQVKITAVNDAGAGPDSAAAPAVVK